MVNISRINPKKFTIYWFRTWCYYTVLQIFFHFLSIDMSFHPTLWHTPLLGPPRASPWESPSQGDYPCSPRQSRFPIILCWCNRWYQEQLLEVSHGLKRESVCSKKMSFFGDNLEKSCHMKFLESSVALYFTIFICSQHT